MKKLIYYDKKMKKKFFGKKKKKKKCFIFNISKFCSGKKLGAGAYANVFHCVLINRQTLPSKWQDYAVK